MKKVISKLDSLESKWKVMNSIVTCIILYNCGVRRLISERRDTSIGWNMEENDFQIIMKKLKTELESCMG